MNRLLLSIPLMLFVGLCLDKLAKDPGRPSAPYTSDSQSIYDYLIYLPKEYKADIHKKWPLLIYLHGKSRRGNDLERLKRYGPPALIKRGKEFPFVVVSPQCPTSDTWNNDRWFIPLHRELTRKYRIDQDRIYLIGMSLGGYGVWYTATTYPEYFAAIVPICGGGNPKLACRIKHIPIWVFHGRKDKIVLPEKSAEMVAAVKSCGGKVRFTLLENMGHDLHLVFHNEKIYTWLLKQRKYISKILDKTTIDVNPEPNHTPQKRTHLRRLNALNANNLRLSAISRIGMDMRDCSWTHPVTVNPFALSTTYANLSTQYKQ
jgi:predicted esterase